MKALILCLLTFGQFVFAGAPAGYPIVKGEVKKVDTASHRVSIKHDAIPNLNMPGMTMSFVAQDPQLLTGLSVGDKINFVADEVDGDLTVLWLEKQTAPSLPIVKGVVRKIDLASNRISIKHDAIPNLNMPAMTMSFLAQDPKLLVGLAVGDGINFMADEIDGELSVVWLEKNTAQGQVGSTILCTGVAPTTPKTNVEIEVRPGTFSTIQYEFAEGSYKGTTYVNSIGEMLPRQEGSHYVYQSGEAKLATILEYNLSGNLIVDSHFSNFSSGMNQSLVQCKFE
jgi:Cu(I)/Ag(I) efflux system protein CusF